MLWDLRSGTCYRTLKPSSGPAYQASWSPDGDLIAAICGGAAGEDSLFFLDSQGQVIRSVAAARVSARVSWSPEGSFLALGCSSGAERVITVFSRSGMPLCNLGGRGGGEIVEWDRTARYVATGGSDGILAFYDAAAIREIRELFWEWAVGSGIFMLFFVSRFLTGFGLLEM